MSIRDPLGEVSFRPSPTKPIPRWMYPAWERTDQQCNKIQAFGARLSTVPSSHAGSDGREFRHRGPSFVSAEPHTLPSSLVRRVLLSDHMSESTFSQYMTPPEYPSATPSPWRTSAEPSSSPSISPGSLSLIHGPPSTANLSTNSTFNPLSRASLQDAADTLSYDPLNCAAHSGTPTPCSDRLGKCQSAKVRRKDKQPRHHGRSALVDHLMEKLLQHSRAPPGTSNPSIKAQTQTKPRRATRFANSGQDGTAEDAQRVKKRTSVQVGLRRLFRR